MSTYNTLLELIIYAGKIEVVDSYVEKGFDINETDSEGMTLLMHLVKPNLYGDHTTFSWTKAVLKRFLRLGADVSLKDGAGRSALDYAKDFTSENWEDVYGIKSVNPSIANESKEYEEIIKLLSKA
jgi:ankyrin repeat protein